MVYVIILLLYLAALIFVGKLASRGVSSSDDWAVAGRSLGVWSSAASYFTTVLSAVSFIGYMGYYYQFGWGGWWNWAGTLICTILFAGFFAARLRRFGGVTISDFLDRRFGKAHGAIAAVLILFSTVLFTMAQLVASASIIKVITGIPEYLSVIIVGIVFLAFTVTGGMKSVAWTSVLTSVLILFGAYALMIAILGKTGGFWELHRLAYTEDPALLDPFAGGSIGAGLALSWCVTWGIGNFGHTFCSFLSSAYGNWPGNENPPAGHCTDRYGGFNCNGRNGESSDRGNRAGRHPGCRHIHGSLRPFTGGNHGNQGYLSEIYQSECRGGAGTGDIKRNDIDGWDNIDSIVTV